MDVIKPIPKSLLIHSARLVKPAETDRWGKTTYAEGIDLRRIRIDVSSKIVKDKNNNEIQLAAVLFFDCRNSSPREVCFAHDDLIEWLPQIFQVKVIEPLYDGSRLHHYEIGLVRYAKNKDPNHV